jgi:hypothetical protein
MPRLAISLQDSELRQCSKIRIGSEAIHWVQLLFLPAKDVNFSIFRVNYVGTFPDKRMSEAFTLGSFHSNDKTALRVSLLRLPS